VRRLDLDQVRKTLRRRSEGLTDRVLGTVGAASRAELRELRSEVTRLAKRVDAALPSRSRSSHSAS
jgi:hypothetical protein